MRRVKLPDPWISYLREAPEAGMGYQKVDVQMSNGREVKGAIVLNGTWIELPDDMKAKDIRSVRLSDR